MQPNILRRRRPARPRPTTAPGETLDQVIAQTTTTSHHTSNTAGFKDDYCLYHLADYKRGGRLLEAYAAGGSAAAERLLRSPEFAAGHLYNGGRSLGAIDRSEYVRWRFGTAATAAVHIPIEDQLSARDPLHRWRLGEHRSACWRMERRGRLGETLLHVLIVCDTRVHTRLARLLVRLWPLVAADAMEGEEYEGASALHLAVAYGNNVLVRELLAAGADVSQRATGTFFLPRDQQDPNTSATTTTSYAGLAYLGELPLAWAACCANTTAYDLLCARGADPAARDRFGNAVLHMCVVSDRLAMFTYALRHERRPAAAGGSAAAPNAAGLTPLMLACRLGRAAVFARLLELSAREFCRYADIACAWYPLGALDTLRADGRANGSSALFVILEGRTEAHLDMLSNGIVRRLLEAKWKQFARAMFVRRLLGLLVHLVLLSLAVYLRRAERSGGGQANATTVVDWQTALRYVCEACTLGGVLVYLLRQLGPELGRQGVRFYCRHLGDSPPQAIFVLSNLLLLGCAACRLGGASAHAEEAMLAVAVPASWALLLQFAGAVRPTGPFVRMIGSMLTGDMLTFGIIYAIVLVGFTQAFYFLYKGHPGRGGTMFETFGGTWMALVQTTLGDYNYADLNHTTHPRLAKTIFALFQILVPILLLNMLVAAMGNTYAHVHQHARRQWTRQWAATIVALERQLAPAEARRHRDAYTVANDDGSDDADGGGPQRGFLVMRSVGTSRAAQRRRAQRNWRLVRRVVGAALRRRGQTGEQMRQRMWPRRGSLLDEQAALRVGCPSVVRLPRESAVDEAIEGVAFAADVLLAVDMADKPPPLPPPVIEPETTEHTATDPPSIDDDGDGADEPIDRPLPAEDAASLRRLAVANEDVPVLGRWAPRRRMASSLERRHRDLDDVRVNGEHPVFHVQWPADEGDDDVDGADAAAPTRDEVLQFMRGFHMRRSQRRDAADDDAARTKLKRTKRYIADEL